jgi:HK97 family phage portal protein
MSWLSPFWNFFPPRSRTPAKLTEPDKWRRFLDGARATSDTALKLSAAYACVRLKSETIGSCPLNVLRPGVRGGEWTVTDESHPLFRILHNKPNADFDSFRFWSATLASLDLHGNAYHERIDGTRGLAGLDFLFPHLMGATSRNGEVIYLYSDPVLKRQREISKERLIHYKQFSQGAPFGISAIAYGSRSFLSSNAIEDTAHAAFINGLRPGGFITTGGKVLTDPQREEVKKNMTDELQGPQNAGKWWLLEGTFDAKPVQITPEDMEMLASRRWTVEDVCRWFTTPPVLIGHMADGQTAWGTGIAETIRAWRMTSLRNTAIAIEKQLEIDLLTPAEIASGMTIRFNLDAILRGDAEERAAFLGAMVDKGIYTRNEARAKENLPPKDGGDELTVQQQMVPLSTIGQRPAVPAIPAEDRSP